MLIGLSISNQSLTVAQLARRCSSTSVDHGALLVHSNQCILIWKNHFSFSFQQKQNNFLSVAVGTQCVGTSRGDKSPPIIDSFL